MRDISFDILPIYYRQAVLAPLRGAITLFFKQPVLKSNFGQGFFELARLDTESFNFIGTCFACGIASEPFLARFEEFLRPAIVEVLSDTFLAAQLRNRLFSAQTFQYDADLLFRRKLAPRCAANIPY
jgi:hypothetical protein